jgi:parvulin-like peptidyl-prolyl isomerase
LNRFAVLVIAFSISILMSCTKGKDTDVNRPIILAKVNGEIITVEDFQKRFDRIKDSYDTISLEISKSLKEIKKSLLHQLITNIILRQEAVKMNVSVTEDEISTQVEKLKAQYKTDELRQVILAKNINITELRKEQEEYLLIKKLTLAVIRQESHLTDKDLLDYYNKNIDSFKHKKALKIQQLVVDSDSVANDILARILKGEDFSEMAKKYSLSPDKDKGGYIDFFEKGTMIPEFDLAFELPLGKISRVIKSPYGYHILKVVEDRPARTLPFSEVKDKIRDILTKDTQEHIYKKWLEKKITTAKIYQNNEVLELIK